MMVLQNLSIRQKLLIILVLPTLLSLYFVGREVWQSLQMYHSMSLIQEQAEVALVAGDLVHELQQERGLTFGSVDWAPSLPNKALEQQQHTNLKLKAFRAKVAKFKTDFCLFNKDRPHSLGSIQKSFCPDFIDQTDSIQQQLDRLPQLREYRQTDTSEDQVFKDYTDLNQRLMQLIALLPPQSQSAKISNYLAAYYYFLLAKDLAGQERAILYKVFAKDLMVLETRHRLINILAEQKAYHRFFEDYASYVWSTIPFGTLDGGALDEAHRLRQIALDRSSHFDVVADNWFAAASEQINLLKTVENQMVADLKKLTKEQRDTAIYELNLLLLFSILSLAGLTILTQRIARGINRQLDHLAHAMSLVEESTDFSVRAEVLSNDELGQVTHYFNGMLENLQTHKDELQRSRYDLNLARCVIEASRDGIMLCDEQGVINYINPAFTVLTGYSEDEAQGHNANLLNSGKQSADFYQQMWQELAEKDYWQGEIWNRRKCGEIYPECLTITSFIDPESRQKLYAGIFSDITEYKKSEALIENLAYYDPLTHLPNRQLFNDRLQVALLAAQHNHHELALISIDLDYFQRINDTLGHTVGDQVLQAVAKRLQGCIKEGNTLSRYSGDGFVIMLPVIKNQDTLHHLIQRIFNVMEASIPIDGHELYVTVSLGASLYPHDGEDPGSLIKNADSAMHRAKQAGRNSFQLYCTEMNQQSLQQLAMGNQLRKALQNNELFLVYQPKLELRSNRIVGVEALLRWRNDKLGFVSPAEFIPLAEDLGLIGEVGGWVLREACLQCRRWMDEGLPPIKISVNVSPQQFIVGGLIREVEKALTQAQLEAQYLDLEITESCIIVDVEQVILTLENLRQKGVSVSMDDFGTGYSSLSYLKKIPLDYLKIDQSFMEGIPGNPDDELLVSTIILMAKNLKYQVIAEGVETAEQLCFLKQLGCEQIQGYFFSRPLPADEISALLLSAAPSFTFDLQLSDKPLTNETVSIATAKEL